MPARWLPSLGLTLEHVRCLREIARGQPLAGSAQVSELVECGFVEGEHQDRLVLTPAGRRYLRLSTIDSSRGSRSKGRRDSAHPDPMIDRNSAA